MPRSACGERVLAPFRFYLALPHPRLDLARRQLLFVVIVISIEILWISVGLALL